MVSLATWIFCTFFVVWVIIQVLSLMAWGVIAAYTGIYDRLSRWDRDSVEKRAERDRRSLGYS
jgi:hypothetical protein